MKIAVTGASGFIGRHVVRELLARGAEVVVVSRSSVLATPVPLSDSITFATLDIEDIRTDTFKYMGYPDALLHLAWGGLPNYRSAKHLSDELPKQAAFLDSCVNSGLTRLIVAGTCLEYGMQPGMLHEDMPAIPCTYYGEAKHKLWQHLHKLECSGALQLTWLRIFYLYGPGQAPTSLYSQLRTALAHRQREFAMSPGDQIRDFLAVESAVSYICEIVLGGGNLGLLNICSGVPRRVVDMVDEWLRDWRAEIHLKLNVYSYPDYEPLAFWGSTSKLEAALKCLRADMHLGERDE